MAKNGNRSSGRRGTPHNIRRERKIAQKAVDIRVSKTTWEIVRPSVIFAGIVLTIVAAIAAIGRFS